MSWLDLALHWIWHIGLSQGPEWNVGIILTQGCRTIDIGDDVVLTWSAEDSCETWTSASFPASRPLSRPWHGSFALQKLLKICSTVLVPVNQICISSTKAGTALALPCWTIIQSQKHGSFHDGRGQERHQP